MIFDIVTIFPDMYKNIFDFGIIGQAQKTNLLQIRVHDLRKWSNNKHKQVDNKPYGGGTGMVLMPEPLARAINELKRVNTKIVFTSPKGKKLCQPLAEDLSKSEHIIFICGRYEGIDQRIIDHFIDLEISIGDYVLSGGEIPVMVIIDAVSRLVPGVIKNEDFNTDESFSNPKDRTELDYPQYTRPEEFLGHKVPDILLTGNHKKISDWRKSKK
jgi:tRNA (guanine37-N1)-methyltransferase